MGENVSQLDFAVLVESDTVVALMQPRQLASWFIRLGERNGDAGALVTGLVRERFDANPQSGVFLEVQTLEGTATSRSAAPVRASRPSPTSPAPARAPGASSTPTGLQDAVSALYSEAVSA